MHNLRATQKPEGAGGREEDEKKAAAKKLPPDSQSMMVNLSLKYTETPRMAVM